MVNIKQEAEAYTSIETKNVVDLESLDISLEMETREFTDKEDKPFTVNVVVIDDVEYRVPTTVLKQIKAILEVKPNLKKVKVTKSGEGLKTTYQVIPL